MRATACLRHRLMGGALLLLLACPPWVSAQDTLRAGRTAALLVDGPRYRIVYDHLSRAVTFQDRDGRTRYSAAPGGGEVLVAEIPPNAAGEVVIENANTLLYDYDVRLVRVAGAEPVYACGEMGRAFLSEGAFISTGAVGDLPTFGGIVEDARTVLGMERSEGMGAEEGGGWLEADLASVELALTSRLERYRLFVDSLAFLSRSITNELVLLAHLAETAPIDSLTATLRFRLEAARPGFSNPALVPVLVARETSLVGVIATAVEARSAEVAGASGLTSQMSAFDGLKVEAAASQAELVRSLRELRRASARSRLTYSFAPVRTAVEVQIRLDDSERVQDEAGNTLARGEHDDLQVQAYLQPNTAVDCRVSIGFSWVSAPPRYFVDSDGAVQEEAADAAYRSGAALFFHLSPSGAGGLAALAGIGLGVGSDGPDLFLGGSLRALSPVLLNAGLAWYRGQALPEGVSLGSTVGSELRDRIQGNRLERRYQRAFFIGFSISR